MYVSVRVTPAEKSMIKSYAEAHGASVSDVIMDAFFTSLEDQLDVQSYKGYLERESCGDVRYKTLDEAIEECGLSDEI
jgi:uncharacterized protein (DUF1778 family)